MRLSAIRLPLALAAGLLASCANTGSYPGNNRPTETPRPNYIMPASTYFMRVPGGNAQAIETYDPTRRSTHREVRATVTDPKTGGITQYFKLQTFDPKTGKFIPPLPGETGTLPKALPVKKK